MKKSDKPKDANLQNDLPHTSSTLIDVNSDSRRLLSMTVEAISKFDLDTAKKSLLKIAESEDKYRAVIENSSYAYFLANMDRTILDANKAAEEMFGYTLEEFKNPNRPKIIDLDDPNLKSSLKVRDKEGKVRGETIGIRKNGERFYVDFSSTVYIDINGETRISNILIDISDRKRKEQEISLLMSYTDESFVLLDTSLNIVAFNKQFSEDFLTIFKKEVVKGDHILNFVQPERIDKIKELYNKVFAGEVQENEMEFTLDGGETKIYVHRHKPIYNEHGTITGVFVSSANITAKKIAERHAEQIQKRFKALVENSQDIISLTDNEGKVIYVSPAYEKITGLQIKNLLGRKHYSNNSPDGIKEADLFLKKIQQNPGLSFPRVHKLLNKDKNYIWLEGAVTNLLEDENIKAIVSNYRDVTSRILLEIELEKERESYVKLFMEAPSIIGVLKGPHHVIQLANPLCEQIIGRKNIIGKEIRDVVPELVSQGFIALLDGVYNTGESYLANEMLFRIDKKQDGNLVDGYSNFLYQAYRNSNDVIEGVFFFANDVTEQVLSRNIILKSEKRFRALVENSMDAIALFDEKFNVLYSTPSAERITGISIVERTQKSLIESIHPNDIEVLKFIMQELLNSPNKPINVLFRNKHKLGHYIWLEGISVNLLHDENVKAIVFNFRDVTERKKIEDQQSLFVSIVNSSDDAIISKDLMGNITSWNQGAEKLFGYKANEAIGNPISFLLPTELSNSDQIILEKIRQIEFIDHYETKRKRKDNSIVEISITASPVRNKDGKIIGTSKIARDISYRKQNEIMLSRLNEQIVKRAEELAISNAELEQFAYVASHDLQEPLRMITSFLTQIENKYNDKLDDRGRQYIHFAVDGAIRMRKIILDLLEFSKIGKVDYRIEKIDLNKLVNEIIQLNRTIINEKEADIFFQDLGIVYCSKTPLQQVLQNLITNALKYQKGINKPLVKINVIELKDYWEISVADNGIGIEPQFFKKIFVLFQRLHNKDEFAGTGIGLAISKKIIENHGGKIWVESKLGEGSTFYFTIKKPE